jgi:hypothetical protein
MAKLTKTTTPGIFRRHVAGCPEGRCDCNPIATERRRTGRIRADGPR